MSGSGGWPGSCRNDSRSTPSVGAVLVTAGGAVPPHAASVIARTTGTARQRSTRPGDVLMRPPPPARAWPGDRTPRGPRPWCGGARPAGTPPRPATPAAAALARAHVEVARVGVGEGVVDADVGEPADQHERLDTQSAQDDLELG